MVLLRDLARSWTAGRRIERVAYAFGAVLFLGGIVRLGVLLLDSDPWTGPESWRKPAMSGLSSGLTLVSVTWACARIRMDDRGRLAAVGLLTVASVVEVALISAQAWRRVPSPTIGGDAACTSPTTGGAAIAVSAVVLLVAAFRRGAVDPPDMRLAVRAGLVLFLVALATTIARGPVADTLEPTHSMALHAVLVLPALSWLLAFTRWTPLARLRVVQLALVGHLVPTVVVGVETAVGVDPLDAPAVAGVGAGFGLFLLGAAVLLACYGVRRFPRRDI
ncbi:hypothetical protein L6E12_14120 [Actinokineospora sp. PR83]|uniref:hypothetical protein n=1 Tax=Actinokineospora sp. PR83 TaxID=2884908 RepID=UPI001F293CAB|nr:hypothetical protein [Actinokineospora sp. PR83]MCG8916927.1 hypothetical protein [Actinokineospora sp. PR83]